VVDSLARRSAWLARQQSLLPIILVCGLVCGVISPAFAEETAPPIRIDTIVVNVFDAHGSAIRDLTTENFHVSLNGKPVAVLHAQYGVAPRRIVVLLDLSGSMHAEDDAKWQIAKEAAGDLLTEISAEVPIAMLGFAGTIHDEFDFSQSRKAMAQWLDGLDRRPSMHPAPTALFDAILKGLKLFGTVQPGDAIYAITDGGENASLASEKQMKAALLHSRVRLFAFLLAEPLLSDEREQKDLFLSLVNDSGGFPFGVAGRESPSLPSWEGRFFYDNDSRHRAIVSARALNLLVNGFWTLQLALPSFLPKKSKLKLEIVEAGGKERDDLEVACPRLPPTK